ncbi:MAG TPA: hypothetical protein VM120_20875 [Bryobacteraceae bacterium]|nr:hypothetical protein [Bryobacteraceae bacterium]
MNVRARGHVEEEPPPFLGAWKRVYIAVLVYLCCLIALFYTFSLVFTPASTR